MNKLLPHKSLRNSEEVGAASTVLTDWEITLHKRLKSYWVCIETVAMDTGMEAQMTWSKSGSWADIQAMWWKSDTVP